MKVSADWLKDFVKFKPPLERVAERLTMAGLEVKKIEAVLGGKDSVLEIDITSNRPDWLSHIGVAREIAAVENLPLKLPRSGRSSAGSLPAGWRVKIKDYDACPYYSGVLIEGLVRAETPDFIRERLSACGCRLINLIVDITNYVLLETGQPLHAFDADLIQGQEIQIRRARENENFLSIGHSQLSCRNQDLVIADRDRIIALAGVMGGAATEVGERTRNIFLEAAFFLPRFIRQSSKRHGITSDSSYRFERRVDPEGVDRARDRALELIQQYGKPRFISGALKAGEKPAVSRAKVHLQGKEIKKVLGVEIKPSEVTSILTRLGLDAVQKPDAKWSVGVPSFRSDLTRAVDLVEEIARLHGYDAIPETLPERPPLFTPENLEQEIRRVARNFCAGIGLNETVTFSLIPAAGLDPETDLKAAVSIVNPQNKECSLMRPVLLPSLMTVIQRNVHFSAKRVCLYEIANVYRRTADAGICEECALGIALYGNYREKTWMDPERPAAFFDLKGILCGLLDKLGFAEKYAFRSSPRSLLRDSHGEEIEIGSENAGFLGEVHPRWIKLWDLEAPVFFGQLFLARLAALRPKEKVLSELPKYPSVERDLSLVVQESVKSDQIVREILRLGGEWVRRVELFDLFRGGRVPRGRKNLAFRVGYQSFERTLLSEEVQALHTQIASELVKKFQVSFQ